MSDIRDEIEFHIEMQTRRFIEAGLDPVTARAKALERMGDIRAAEQRSRAILAAREANMPAQRWLWTIGQDLRHAFRVLKRAPGFVTIAVVMLALGTGAGTAVFSVVDGVILRSPFNGVESIAYLQAAGADGRVTSAVPRETYEHLLGNLPAPVLAVGVATLGGPIVTRVDTPRRTQTECLSASMAQILGTRPLMGRWFTADEDRPGQPPVALVSAKFWKGTLGSDPDVLGRTIALDDTPVTIVGVTPAGFDGPYSRVNRDIFVPAAQSTSAVPLFDCRPLGATVNVMARVAPGVSMETAATALNAAAGTTNLSLAGISEDTTGDLQNPFNALVGAVLAVLLIAFANVTNLGLERLAGRRRELAVRIAMGATRGRIIRETVAEHVLVSMAGAVLGVGVAFVSFDAMMALLPESLPNRDAVSLNARVMAGGLLLALLGGLCSGVLSAFHASAESLRGGLAAGDRGYARGSTITRRVLVASELALGVLLLVGALLMIQTFLTLRPSSPGFDASDKHIALVRLPPATPASERLSFIQRVSDEVARAPGVRAVAATTSIPMRRTVALRQVTLGDKKDDVNTGSLSANYIDTMQIPVRRGRGFTKGDTSASTPVAVVNEAFVRAWLDGSEPLGVTLTMRLGPNETTSLRIVGVIGDTRSFGTDTRIRPFVYMPLAQLARSNAFFVVHVQDRAAAALPAAVREAVGRLLPGQLVDEVASLEDEMNAEVARPRLGAWLFGLFAALAVLLGAVGLAATLAWSVAQRRREIGIRMALGAQPRDVRRLVVGQMLGLSLAGVAAGLFAASVSTELIKGWLYGVTPLDLPTFIACGLLTLVVSAMAAYVPTRSATRVDPVLTLRGD